MKAGLTFGLPIPRLRSGQAVQGCRLIAFGRVISVGRATTGKRALYESEPASPGAPEPLAAHAKRLSYGDRKPVLPPLNPMSESLPAIHLAFCWFPLLGGVVPGSSS
jgi:hypothetical protein